MTEEEREQLEKDYPSINWPRLMIALTWCGIILIVAGIWV